MILLNRIPSVQEDLMRLTNTCYYQYTLLSPRNFVVGGYCNASVRPSVCLSVRLSVTKCCGRDTGQTVVVRIIKLGILINNVEEKNPIDFQPQRSKVPSQLCCGGIL